MGYQGKIIAAIEGLSSKFDTDELAYLALTSKIENPIRDKIAYIFHSELYKKALICREWKTSKNKRVDLAILDTQNRPKCLIEFKAHSAIGREKNYKDWLTKELNKIANAATENTELYYIFLCNLPHKTIPPEYSKAVKYFEKINGHLSMKPLNNIEDDLKKNWTHYTEGKEKNPTIIRIKGGEYYGIEVTIHAFVYGPLNKSNILKKSKTI